MTARALLLLTLVSAQAAFAQAKTDSSVDPKARQALDAMARAYRSVGTFQQETVYAASDTSVSGAARTRLVLQKPNKLLVETSQKGGPGEPPFVSRYQCDGKFVYAYNSTQGWYTKEKAPKDVKGFQMLAISVEMAAISGLDPVTALLRQASSVTLEEPAEVDGVETDVVAIRINSADRRAETRLYVGRKDHFLRRFTFYSEVIPKPEPEKPARQFDPNNPNDRPVPPPPPVKFSYDNIVSVDKPLGKDLFSWVAPPNAFEYRPLTGYAAKGEANVEAGGLIPGTNQVAPRAMKIISMQELMKKAKKANGK
jgi:outer membrane lipoprotein-sorting protein